MDILGDQAVTVHEASLSGNDFNLLGMLETRVVNGVGDAGPRETLQTLRIDKLKMGENDFSAILQRNEDNSYQVVIEGARFDLQALLDDRKERIAAEPDVNPHIEEPGPVFTLQANIDHLSAGPKRNLTNASLELRHDGLNVDLFELSAKTARDTFLNIDFIADGDGHNLKVTSNNAGQSLSALNWTDRIEGGALEITGHRASQNEPIIGEVKIDHYLLVEAPIMAKVFEFMSLTGALSSLGQSGLPFTAFEAKYSYQNGVLSFDKTRAYGASIGFTGEGYVDIDSDYMKVKGTVVPAYAINQIIGAIPIIGFLLTGGNNEGIFAANYSVEGPLEDPEVKVNPLSVLAPGFLRKLFNILPDAESSATPLPKKENGQ
jgi:hypothetical protein